MAAPESLLCSVASASYTCKASSFADDIKKRLRKRIALRLCIKSNNASGIRFRYNNLIRYIIIRLLIAFTVNADKYDYYFIKPFVQLK